MKNPFIYLLSILAFLFYSDTFCQRVLKLSIDTDGEKSSVSYVTRNENVYVSIIEMTSVLSGDYYYNHDAIKIEVKFENHTIKFTARNQFVVLFERESNTQTVYQLPISTLLINKDIFIPLQYCIQYLTIASGKEIIFDSPKKQITIKSKSIIPPITKSESEKEKTPPNMDIATENKSFPKHDIYEMTIEDKTNGTLIRLKSSKNIAVPRSSINNNTLYVFFSNISIAPDIVNKIKHVGFVKRIKRTAVSSKNIQLEFLLAGDYSSSEIYRDPSSYDILITIRSKFINPESTSMPDVKSKWIMDAVVIDAGHGGKDPGAIGVTGIKEKDINLAIALKLGNLIENNLPGVKVIYTRKRDEFVELYKRGKIANEAGGKLFISIHCNSTPKKGTNHRGFEVYLLRPGRTKEAIDIAEFENSVIRFEDNPQRYQQLTDENFILVSMAHSQYMRYSEKFSDILNQDWKKNVGIPSLGIKQAGFYVLVGASMPSVLIETGFLSNKNDEAYLTSSKGQTEIAHSIFNSIKKYKEFYDKEIGN